MERKQINGVDLAYRTAGQAESRPVVLIHGFTGNTRNWALTVKPLIAAGFRTLSADNPGHGHSSAPETPESYTMTAMADLLHILAKEEGFAPAVVIGHSMGGAIAEEYAVRHPQDVSALVLVDSAGGGPRDNAAERFMRDAMAQAAEIAFSQGMGALWDWQVDQGTRAGISSLPAETRDLLRAEFALTSPHGYVHCGAGMQARNNTLPALSELGKPVLVIRGEHESPGLVQAAEGLATIPGARYEIIPGAGHSPQMEAPTAFNAVLIDFLKSLP